MADKFIMAEQDTKPEVSISKRLHQFKVGDVSICHEVCHDAGTARYSCCAGLRLKGKWLEEAGFTILMSGCWRAV